MIVNPNEFQAIVVNRNNKMKDFYPLNINQEVLGPAKWRVTVSGELWFMTSHLES